MATEQGHTQEFDLERTDRLPILTGELLNSEAGDVAVTAADSTSEQPALQEARDLAIPLGSPVRTALTTPSAFAITGLQADLTRNSAIDLPSLAESLRSVEERIVHQQTEYEVLSRSFERSRDSEEAAKLRAGQLEADLASVRSLLELEQSRAREQDKGFAERTAAFEAARNRTEEALCESERHQSESRVLKDSLAARDATISQVLHSLGERDAQVTALQQAHVEMEKSMQARGRTGLRLEADLQAANLTVQELRVELATSKESIAAGAAKAKLGDADFERMRAELGAARTQAASHLELLRSREYRRGFEENLLSELHAKVGVADASQSALQADCERLMAQAAKQHEKIEAQSIAMEKLQSTVAECTAASAKQASELKNIELARAELSQRLNAAEGDLKRTKAELEERETALNASRGSASSDAQRLSASLAAAERRQVEQAEHFATLQSEHAAATATMQSRHAGILAELQAAHAQQISQIQGEQMGRVSELQSSYTASTSRAVAEQSAEMERQKALHASFVAQAEARSAEHTREMSELMSHLLEARRPLEPVQAEVKRLTDALTAKSAAFDDLDAEARKLRISLERTQGALEEREFLIRRLERSENNNANVLGRIQTSMERLGSGRMAPSSLGNLPECTAELIRIDGGRNITHPLGRRTRIGRGVGCELQVDSTSVSRHHAMIAIGPRDAIVEDLNSTNGVILNGRKITRAFLTDGDTLIVGEVQFRYVANGSGRAAAQPPLESPPLN